MSYATLKLIHVSAVVLSFLGFMARGIGALTGAAWVRHRATRVAPHLVDTALLLSAVGMLWVIRLPPWAAPWLMAKLGALVAYVVLGAIALRPALPGRVTAPRSLRLLAWIGALAIFGYIVSVAVTKSPCGLLPCARNIHANVSVIS
jgi:uncharacterized membrane protein SirB2